MRFAPALIAAFALLASGSSTAATADAGCDAAGARAALAAYIQAFNRGEFAKLQPMFAVKPDFQWFSVAPPYGRVREAAYNRASLMRYFRARHAKQEVLQVVRFIFATAEERNGVTLAHFNGRLTRKAADLPRELRGFKAVIRCGTTPQFVVISIGTKF